MSYQNEEEERGEEEEEDVPQQVDDLANASVPNALRGIRACKRCGILKTIDQFVREGCENCPFLDMVRRCCVDGRSKTVFVRQQR
jgi:transcription elongation factor SPT4